MFLQVKKEKPRPEEIPHERVTAEKVTVGRRYERSQEDEIETHRKHLDIGRIVIEDISEEKEVIPEPETAQEELVTPKRTDITVHHHDVKHRATKNVKKDVVKVGKLDTAGLDRLTEESWQVHERTTTPREAVDGRKVYYYWHKSTLVFPSKSRKNYIVTNRLHLQIKFKAT